MKIKLIASDLDGTLLNEHKTIGEQNARALKKAVDKGVLFVPATGRVFATVPKEIMDICDIKYVITSNGAAVFEIGKEKAIFEVKMPNQKTLELIKFLKPINCIIEVYIDGKGYFEQSVLDNIEKYAIPPHFQKMYKEFIKNPVEDIYKFVEESGKPAEKINVPWLTPEQLSAITEGLKKFDGIHITSSLDSNVEINDEKANKGYALAALCDILGIDVSDAMALGDGNNDLEMIKTAGVGVAMENANQSLKDVADFVTKSCDEGGVAYAVEKFAL